MLDEIGELTPALQAKLLHVLQDAEFTKLGSNKRVNVDVRIVAATNRDLEKMMVSGGFREDLYYRLRVIELTVPALRDRRDEIPALTESFIARYARKYKRAAPRISPQLRQLFLEYEWPGNIRELENTIKRLVILQDEQIAIDEIERSMRRAATAAAAVRRPPRRRQRVRRPPRERSSLKPLAERPWTSETPLDDQAAPGEAVEPAEATGGSLAAVARAAAMKAERALIEKTLNQVHWNRRKASQILEVSYKTLLNKIKECSITRD